MTRCNINNNRIYFNDIGFLNSSKDNYNVKSRRQTNALIKGKQQTGAPIFSYIIVFRISPAICYCPNETAILAVVI